MDMLAAADEYFNNHIHSEVWYGVSKPKRTAVLVQAGLQLETYRRRTTASRFCYAVCEQALWLLQSREDTRAALQQAGVTSFSLGNLSEQYNVKGRPTFIAPAAWSFLEKQGVKVGRLG